MALVCPATDDDTTFASTMAVGHLSLQKPDSSQSSGKSVRFDLSSNCERCDDASLHRDETLHLWYSSTDYKEFKKSTLISAKSINESEKLNLSPFSYQRVVEYTYDVCKQAAAMAFSGDDADEPGLIGDEEVYLKQLLTPDVQSHLERWAADSPSWVGMERWVIRAIGKERSARRYEVVDAVMDMQEGRIQISLHPKEAQSASTQQAMRLASVQISRPSRLFALAVARAQAAALASEA